MTKYRAPKKRTVYNNYDLSSYEDIARETLTENGNEDPTDSQLWEEIYFLDSITWEEEKERLKDFFKGSRWILQGYTGTWRGAARGGFIFNDFMDAYYKATKDCDYVHIYDENGHFYIKCSHHDGTNLYEIKEVTADGIEYLERWENNLNDKRTEEYVHDMVMLKYSRLPHFANKVYGSKRIEWETEEN